MNKKGKIHETSRKREDQKEMKSPSYTYDRKGKVHNI
jgi:hypothetical protein